MKILTLPYTSTAPQKHVAFQADKTQIHSKTFDIFYKSTVQSKNTRFTGNGKHNYIDDITATAVEIDDALREGNTKPLNDAINAGLMHDLEAVFKKPILVLVVTTPFDKVEVTPILKQKKKQILSELIKHGADVEKAKEYIHSHYRERDLPDDNFPSSMFYHDPVGAQMYNDHHASKASTSQRTSTFGYELISDIENAQSNWSPWGIIDTLTGYFSTK